MEKPQMQKRMGRPPIDLKSQEKTRRQIIETAKTLFSEQGIDAVSMRKIAAKSGFSQRLPYLYFKNKQEILRYIWEDFFICLFEECHSSITGVVGAKKRLETFLRAYVNYWFEHPDQYELVFLNKDQIGGADDKYYVDEFGVVGRYDIFTNLVQSCMDEGEIKQATPDLYVQTMLCSLHGLLHCLITISEYPWQPKQDLIDNTIQTLFGGMRP